MSRGFFAGVAWGSVVAGLGLVTASQVAGVPDRQATTNIPAVTTPLANEPSAEAPDPEPQAKSVVPEDEPLKEPVVVPVEPKSDETAKPAEAMPDSEPETKVAIAPVIPSAEPTAPMDEAEPVEATRAAEPELPKPDAQTGVSVAEAAELPTEEQLRIPGAESVPQVSQVPALTKAEAKPDAPQPVDQVVENPDVQQTVLVPVSPDPTKPAPVISAQPDIVSAEPSQSALPVQPVIDAIPDAADLPPLPPLTPEEEAAIDAAGRVGPEPESKTTEPAMTAPPAVAFKPNVIAPADDQIALVPSVRPTPGFGGKVKGVKTGRLPRIGAPEPAPATEPESVQNPDAESPGNEATPVVEIPDESLPPIERFAREFENDAAKPLFAILLWDSGDADVDRAALADLPFPVSFVIDPAGPKAAEIAKIYRSKGQEVVMLASSLPTGATASDLAVAFEAHAQALPEAVAVVDMELGGFQGNRNLAAQVLAVVGDQGRGMLSWDRGLNAASQIARREGLRNATIYRKLDENDETSTTIQRYLDRAAFKAAQDGRVVVAGQTRPETVAALLEWAVEGRASTVAIAPVTAVLIAQ